jgi:hypothetical protein
MLAAFQVPSKQGISPPAARRYTILKLLRTREIATIIHAYERIGSVSEASEARKTSLQKLLDLVESAGNKVPHPAVLFFLLIVVVLLMLRPRSARISLSNRLTAFSRK